MAADILIGDLLETALATVLFVPVLLLPGFALLAFGRSLVGPNADWRWHAAGALVLSVAVLPGLIYGMGRLGGFGLIVAVLAILSVWGLVAWWRRRDEAAGSGPLWPGLALLAAWLVVGYVTMADLPVGDGLALNVMMYDYVKHVSVTDALARTGFPPLNPSLWLGQGIALFYYHFWFMLASVVDVLGGALVGPRAAVQGATLWAGPIFMAMVFLVLRRNLTGGLGLGVGLVGLLVLVTGLDLLPTLAYGFIRGVWETGPGVLPDIEWWNDQVSSWLSTILWVPHHLAGFVACVVGFMLMRDLEDKKGHPVALVGLSGASFASAAGLSVWVTLVAAIIFAVWTLYRAFKRDFLAVGWHLAIGLVALAIAGVFLFDLQSANRLHGAPVAVLIREFYPVSRLSEWFGVDFDCGPWCRLALLPVSYGLELGFYALVVPIYWGWRRRQGRPLDDDERLTLVMVVVSLIVCSVLRSAIHNNDLGWRGLLFAQLGLLIWAVPVARALVSGGAEGLPRIGRRTGYWLVALAVIGMLGTGASWLRIRLWPPTHQAMELRQAYTWLDRNSPTAAVTQHNPHLKAEGLQALYGHRQVAVSDQHFGKLYGINAELFESVYEPVVTVFNGDGDVARARAVAARFGIDYLLAKHTDPVWQNRQSWVWAVEAIYETPGVRIIRVADLPG